MRIEKDGDRQGHLLLVTSVSYLDEEGIHLYESKDDHESVQPAARGRGLVLHASSSAPYRPDRGRGRGKAKAHGFDRRGLHLTIRKAQGCLGDGWRRSF